ncbi:hypothetical protein [uncultured Roseibium sp.]|uniref:hypothetical protein n=1 Tax=uncultured Roseibium sp. TaxID=1936171 RepID=UPI0026260A50|nr:hypothetical protein [uncultured Roseibium sp.]
MTRRLHDYSPHELTGMASRLKVLAANKRSCADISEKVALAGNGFSNAPAVARGYRQDAAMLDAVAGLLTQISKTRTGAGQ